MKLLIAPAHYLLNGTDGSEYTRAYEYIHEVAMDGQNTGDILAGYCEEKTIGSFTVHTLWKKRPAFITIFHKIQFMLWIFRKGRSLLRNNTYDALWHLGPFAIGETFSLLALFNKGTKFIIGPIYTPFETRLFSGIGYFQKDDNGNIRSLSLRYIADIYLYRVLVLLSRPLSIRTLRRANHVVTIEEKGKEILSSFNVNNVSVIPLSIDASNFSCSARVLKKGQKTILAVGYLIDRKRTSDIIESIALLSQSNAKEDMHLEIIGDGPERKAISDQIKRLNLSDYITLHGYIDRTKIMSYFKNADVFVSASDTESMPGVYFEAMTAALPMIVTENHTSLELKRKNFGGIVVLNRKPTAIADALLTILKNPTVYNTYSKRNIQLMKTTYNFKTNMKRFMALFEKQSEHVVTPKAFRFSWIALLGIGLFVSSILFFSVRGLPGNPSTQDLLHASWKENGPFELSPERGRFALTKSLVEKSSVYFEPDLARFVLPDVGYRKGRYVSLFAPTVSFLVVPGYILGKLFGSPQVGTFLNISIFALLNVFLIYLLSRKLSLHSIASMLGGLIFLFASPAYSYGVNLYQHHVTVAITLISTLAILSSATSFINSFSIFFLWMVAVTIDYPNAFMLLPVGFALLNRLIRVESIREYHRITIRLWHGIAVIGVVLPLLFFMWFNKTSYGGPFTMLSGSAIVTVHDIDKNGNPIAAPGKSEIILKATDDEGPKGTTGALSYFKTRNLLNGLYIHLFSPDRGILVFAPVFLLGIYGVVLLYKSYPTASVLLSAISLINLTLYSMWGDPWGGWAFGSRYLIPSYAILSIFLAVVLDRYKKNIPVLLFILLLTVYSVRVNTAGALSSSANPPQVQVLSLEAKSGRQERYSFDRNLEYLKNGHSKSFAYQAWFKQQISAWQYFMYMYGLISGFIGFLFILLFIKRKTV